MTVHTRADQMTARRSDSRVAVKRRNSARNVIAVWLLAMSAAGGLGAGLLSSSCFRVTQVHVYCPDESLRQEAVERAQQLEFTHIWRPPTREIEREIGGLPRVREVRVEREPPRALGLHVLPRLPVAVVEAEGRLMLVDEDGVCLNWTGQADQALLILRVADSSRLGVGEMLDERDARLFGEVLSGLAQVGLVAGSRLDLSNANRIEVFTGDGVLGKLGDDTLLRQKSVLFGKLLRSLQDSGRPPIYIDLRVPSHPTYRPLN